MEKVCGAGCNFVSEADLLEAHRAAFDGAVATYDRMATLASSLRAEKRKELGDALLEAWRKYEVLNKERDPYKHFAVYVVPMAGIAGELEFSFSFSSSTILFTHKNVGKLLPLLAFSTVRWDFDF
tara:strand:- start:320 stop:694 length:375 start_codon:yes stop_codon:yes gene_type:complete